MSRFWKVVLSTTGLAVISVASAVFGVHKMESIRSTKLSDVANETRARAEQGDVAAEYKLAQLYYEGRGVPQDYAEASRWYRKAAEQGYAIAQFALGDLYFHGIGVRQDYAETVRWTQKAADQGYAKAESGLGYLYSNGVGVSQNYVEAFRWYNRAADQGNVEAEYALGYMCRSGIGVPQNQNEAVRWFHKAADQGDAEAQTALGSMYANGLGVQQNRTEAYLWLRRAADHGNPKARHALELLWGESMTKWRWLEFIAALIAIPVGLWASLEFMLPGRILKNRRQMLITLLGVCFLSIAGLSLYAFAHYDMQFSPHKYAFHIARLFFTALAIPLVVVVVLPAKKKAPVGGPGLTDAI